MNPVDKAIEDVFFNIPKEVLQRAFVGSHYGYLRYPVTIESQIKEKVVQARVLKDCNLVGGVQVVVDVSNLRPILDDGQVKVYKIPKSLTENRSISMVLSASYDDNDLRGIGNQPNGGSLISASHRVVDSAMGHSPAITADLNLIGDNTVLIKDGYTNTSSHIYTLRCILNNDPNMSNLKPTTIPAFSELVLLATKAWIYTNVIIPMDRGELTGGMELGRFKEIIDEFADANQMYKEYIRDTWTKVAMMDDHTSHFRHIKMILPG